MLSSKALKKADEENEDEDEENYTGGKGALATYQSLMTKYPLGMNGMQAGILGAAGNVVAQSAYSTSLLLLTFHALAILSIRYCVFIHGRIPHSARRRQAGRSGSYARAALLPRLSLHHDASD
jgi:hypothetical protein